METSANSAEMLVEGNDGVLMEILYRLPPKSVLRFRCVSKRWNDLVCDRFFQLKYGELRRRSSKTYLPIMAFFQKITGEITPTYYPRPPPISIVPTHENLEILKFLPRRRKLGYLVNTSNGILLFSQNRTNCNSGPGELHLLNPITKRWIMVPPNPKNNYYRQSSVALACEGITTEVRGKLAANYIVVRVGIRSNNAAMAVETYSSNTREWRESTLACTESDHLVDNKLFPPLVFNGVIHWLSSEYKILMYDPNENDSHMQFIDIPCPYRQDDDDIAVSMTYGRSADDVLLYGAITTKNMEIWMLPKKGKGGGYERSTTIKDGEWVLLRSVGLDFLLTEIKEAMSDSNVFPLATNVRWNLRFEAFIPCDPLVVVLLFGAETIVYYRWASDSVEVASCRGFPVKYKNYKSVLCPYIESPFLSSYAL